MTDAKFKELIGYDQLTKADLLAKLVALGNNLDGIPTQFEHMKDTVEKGRLWAMALLMPEAEQIKQALDPETITEIEALRAKLDPVQFKRALRLYRS